MSAERRPVFGLSFDPRALTDLLEAPDQMRDHALSRLQDVVTAREVGRRLSGDLDGYRKLVLEGWEEWRLVYGPRSLPRGSEYGRVIHVVAVRPRMGNDAYDTVGHRLGMTRRPLSARTHAARAASPQLSGSRPVPTTSPPVPGPARPTAGCGAHRAPR
ncbi:hypothetical protein RM572_26470 [Streptomyces sp. DSM 42041]|uniref:Uncharacterized protein n=1 Tax=Streptomyces hazeniae TaxID=3075538 RepID=A0ABU2P342_9ACTN|nr:hypothetical protein [Streptomyces sp. DSM 42041]MDT0382308.1 hypothetical protein [Streptomyces sp. DSM 42041]